MRKIGLGNDQAEIEAELFSPLLEEIDNFCETLYGEALEWDRVGFLERLKFVLEEQPVTINPGKRLIGYDQSLTLVEFEVDRNEAAN